MPQPSHCWPPALGQTGSHLTRSWTRGSHLPAGPFWEVSSSKEMMALSRHLNAQKTHPSKEASDWTSQRPCLVPDFLISKPWWFPTSHCHLISCPPPPISTPVPRAHFHQNHISSQANPGFHSLVHSFIHSQGTSFICWLQEENWYLKLLTHLFSAPWASDDQAVLSLG